MSEHISLGKEIKKVTEQDLVDRDSWLDTTPETPGEQGFYTPTQVDAQFKRWLDGSSEASIREGLRVYQERLNNIPAEERDNWNNTYRRMELSEKKKKLERRMKAMNEHLETKSK